MTDGELSPAHAGVLAVGTHDLPDQVTAEAEPVLVEAARRLDPGRRRRVISHLCLVADLDSADRQTQRRHGRRGVWLASTWEGMVAVNGLLEAEAGQTLLAALEPLARPANADDTRSGGQRQADVLTELARRSLEAGRLPQTGGVRPQLMVLVDLRSLQGRNPLGGEVGWTGPLDPAACQRLACDGAVTRVLVIRQPTSYHGRDDLSDDGGDGTLAARLRAAAALLPPVLGGAPSQPLDSAGPAGSSSPPNGSPWPSATAGCVFPGCDRPLAWCDAHHPIPGWTAAPPTSRTWPCCAGPITGPSTRAAGG